jgi:hypothetical protein
LKQNLYAANTQDKHTQQDWAIVILPCIDPDNLIIHPVAQLPYHNLLHLHWSVRSLPGRSGEYYMDPRVRHFFSFFPQIRVRRFLFFSHGPCARFYFFSFLFFLLIPIQNYNRKKFHQPQVLNLRASTK